MPKDLLPEKIQDVLKSNPEMSDKERAEIEDATQDLVVILEGRKEINLTCPKCGGVAEWQVVDVVNALNPAPGAIGFCPKPIHNAICTNPDCGYNLITQEMPKKPPDRVSMKKALQGKNFDSK